MSLYAVCQQMGGMLRNVETWLDDAEEYAKQREFDPDVLLQMRLHPDMRPLVFQIQSAADAVKLAFARLTGKDAPVHEDNEATLADVRARLRSVQDYLATFTEADFDGAATRLVRVSFAPPGKQLRGENYLLQFAQPNFYFHITTAYGLLRHAGVKLGKRRFIQHVTFEDA